MDKTDIEKLIARAGVLSRLSKTFRVEHIVITPAGIQLCDDT